MDATDPLDQAKAIADAIEQIANQLTPAVIRAARNDGGGRNDLDRIEEGFRRVGEYLSN